MFFPLYINLLMVNFEASSKDTLSEITERDMMEKQGRSDKAHQTQNGEIFNALVIIVDDNVLRRK